MKRSSNYAVILCLMVGALSACSATPTQKWAAAREALTTAETQATSAAKAGKLTSSEIVVIDVGFQSARAALDDAAKRLPDGDGPFKADMNLVSAILMRLSERYLAPPTSQPATTIAQPAGAAP